VGLGCTRSWEGTQLGQLTPADRRDIPHRMTSCSAYKSGEGEGTGGGEDVQSDGVCLPRSPLHVMELCFAGDG